MVRSLRIRPAVSGFVRMKIVDLFRRLLCDCIEVIKLCFLLKIFIWKVFRFFYRAHIIFHEYFQSNRVSTNGEIVLKSRSID